MTPETTPPPRRRDSRGRTGGPVPMSEALGALADRLGLGQADVVQVIFGRWTEIVGAGVAAHVRPLKVAGTTLVVNVDHPAWATQVRHLAPDILARLSEVCGGALTPQRLEVRVRK
jgi:predicted nucleic acid-binding Zn ribbon protein